VRSLKWSLAGKDEVPMDSETIRITVLVDNKPGNGLTPEHGLSLWIETEDCRILFDTGQGHALFENAGKLGVPLEKTDFIVLSHGHYDHTGGVAGILRAAPKACLVLHEKTMIDRYSIPEGKSPHRIGVPQLVQDCIEGIPKGGIVRTRQPFYLKEQICVTGTIFRETPFEDAGGSFFLDLLGKNADPVADDQALWIKKGEGLVICVGCSHAGLINTIRYSMHLAGASVLRAVIGGFHLINAGSKRLNSTAEALESICPEMLVPCHCTGDRAVDFLKDRFGKRVSPCHSGMIFEF
jgi:7,8-dihydropterin-6-yl-methyl-4-(beta-D-ribofuranosyl)aminobenzene 5'-phosphate synthase